MLVMTGRVISPARSVLFAMESAGSVELGVPEMVWSCGNESVFNTGLLLTASVLTVLSFGKVRSVIELWLMLTEPALPIEVKSTVES